MQDPISARDLSKLTTQIYAAALNYSRWGEVFQTLYDLSGGVRMFTLGFDARTNTSFDVVSPHVDPDFLAIYHAHYEGINPWPAGTLAVPVGAPIRCEEAFPSHRLKRTEFYNDWVRPQDDIFGGGGVVLARDSDRLAILSGNIRGKDIEKLENRWMALVGLLVPHLQQALEISRTLGGQALETMAARMMIGPGFPAVLVIAANGMILFANAQAEALLGAGTLLARDPRNRLRVPAAGGVAVTRALEALAAGLAPLSGPVTLTGPDDLVWRGQMAVLDPRGIGFSPFDNFCSHNDRCLLLALSDAAKPLDLAARLVRDYGLSVAEAGVALLLNEGKTTQEIAAARQVSVHTVRNQIKAALMKTGTRRQADLVCKVEAARHGAVSQS